MINDQHEWIPAKEAAELLRMSVRQAHRYGESGRIATRKTGRQVLFSRVDTEALAETLHVDLKPQPPAQRADLLPASELFSYLQKVQEDMNQAMLEIGRLQGQLGQQRLLVEASEDLQRRNAALEQERDALQARVQELEREREAIQAAAEHAATDEQQRRPWWQRLFSP